MAQQSKDFMDNTTSKLAIIETYVETLSTRLTAVENQKAGEKVDRLDGHVRELNGKLSELKGIIGVVSLIFIIISGFGAWNLYKYSEFEAARSDMYAILVSQMREKIATEINKLKVTENPDEQRTRIADLSKLHNHLKNLNVRGDDFENNGQLIEALRLMVVEGKEKREEARKLLDRMRSTRDNFIKSRVLTLLAAIEISKHRGTTSDDLKGELLEAIKLDSMNAFAFNGIGIISANQASQKLENNQPEEAKILMRQAEIGFKMALDLAPSPAGASRYVNNKLWSQLPLIKWYLDRKQPLEELSGYLGFPSLKIYFQNARNELKLYTSLTTGSPAALETEAQSMLLEAQYARSEGRDADADGLENTAAELFLRAIDRGVYEGVKDAREAFNQFKNDALHTSIKDKSQITNRIEQGINDWFNKKR